MTDSNETTIDRICYYGVLLYGVTTLILNVSATVLPALILLLMLLNFKNYKQEILSRDNMYIISVIFIAIILGFISDGGPKSAYETLRKSYRFIPLIIFPILLCNFKRVEAFIYSIGIAIIMVFIKGIYFYKKNNFNFNLRFQSFRGIMDNSHGITALSFLILGMLIFYIKDKNKKMIASYLLFYTLSLIIIFLSKTRGSWLAFMIAFPLFFFFVNKKRQF